MDKFYTITGELYGCIGTGDGGTISISYKNKDQADRAFKIIKELEEIAYEVVETLEPDERCVSYSHIQSSIDELGLKSLVTAMFDDELELGRVKLTEMEFNKFSIIKV